ncbi:hypothetical protein [Paraburkholderia phosphatilytica]|uniref:hypothetical protein n=1 Tax=Paraburkholderia phosphatilytica TaxID=2282883 RepID=UPI000E4BBE1D|nr:hypothetical protein [Paraburkholderia phosphatilytica]
MNHRARLRHEHEVAVLARMEFARIELLAANVGLRMGDHSSVPRDNKLSLSNLTHALSAAPNVTLLGSVVLGMLLVGPKRIVPVVLRTGFTSWVARNVRGVVGR